MRSSVLTAGVLVVAAGLTMAAPVKAKPAKAAVPPTNPQRDANPERPQPYRMQAETLTPTQILTQRPTNQRGEPHTHARIWSEMLIFAIRRDLARPTVHARNLYHIHAAMYDAWAAFDSVADQVVHQEKMTVDEVAAERNAAIAYAAARLIQHRFQFSPGAFDVYPEVDNLLTAQGYDPFDFNTDGNTGAALGNRIANSYIEFGYNDGSNEANGYANQFYQPVNPPLLPDFPGNPDMLDPDRWQPLALQFFKDQNGNPIPTGYPPFLSPEWGDVTPFSLRPEDASVLERDGRLWKVYHDQGHPPYLGEQEMFKWGFEMVSTWGAHLDPSDGVMWDVSPNNIGNTLPATMDMAEVFYDRIEGGVVDFGYTTNPVTGQPYAQQIVPRGDYTRILAEFWADGPSSETPPGHWFSIMHYVMDHPQFERRFMGQGDVVDALEYDVKAHVALGGTLHDVAIACWGTKGYYDYVRPVSAIRYMCQLGQCTDPNLGSYHANGVNLIPDLIELVTEETTAPGGKHEHLAGSEGKIAIRSWRGPDYIAVPATDVAGVGWILADNWWPYQRPSFVSPPFAGYYSGHSTYSRAAAELLTRFTGSPYFPGGLGEFLAPQNQFLVFEDGPSVDVVLQWVSYVDASDQCSLSRIWGGIHPPQDDLPGRIVGQIIGPEAFTHARRFFNGQVSCPADFSRDNAVTVDDVPLFVAAYQSGDMLADMAAPYNELNFFDVAAFLNGFATGCD